MSHKKEMIDFLRNIEIPSVERCSVCHRNMKRIYEDGNFVGYKCKECGYKKWKIRK